MLYASCALKASLEKSDYGNYSYRGHGTHLLHLLSTEQRHNCKDHADRFLLWMFAAKQTAFIWSSRLQQPPNYITVQECKQQVFVVSKSRSHLSLTTSSCRAHSLTIWTRQREPCFKPENRLESAQKGPTKLRAHLKFPNLALADEKVQPTVSQLQIGTETLSNTFRRSKSDAATPWLYNSVFKFPFNWHVFTHVVFIENSSLGGHYEASTQCHQFHEISKQNIINNYTANQGAIELYNLWGMQSRASDMSLRFGYFLQDNPAKYIQFPFMCLYTIHCKFCKCQWT